MVTFFWISRRGVVFFFGKTPAAFLLSFPPKVPKKNEFPQRSKNTMADQAKYTFSPLEAHGFLVVFFFVDIYCLFVCFFHQVVDVISCRFPHTLHPQGPWSANKKGGRLWES